MNRVLKLVFAAFCWCGALLSAQIPVDTPYEDHGSYAINLQNLSIVVSAPVRAKSGLIGFNAGTTGATGIVGSDGVSKISSVSGISTPIAANGLLPSGVSSTYNALVNCAGGGQGPQYINFSFNTGDGNHHALPSTDYLDCNHTSFVDTLVDGSGYTVSVSNTAQTIDIYSAGGLHVSGTFIGGKPTTAFTSLTDTNGNAVSYNVNTGAYTDSLGLTVLNAGIPGTNPRIASWTDVNGGTQQTVLTATPYKIKTAYGCASPNQDLIQTVASNYLTGVSFADGRSLGIAYESTGSGYISGQISSVILPTGGSVTFTRSGFQCLYLEPTTLTRMDASGTWTYTWTPTFATAGYWNGNQTTVTDPAGNKTTYIFSGTSNNMGSWSTGPLLVQTVVKQGSSTTLSTKTYCYNNVQTNCATPSAYATFPITQVDVYTQLAGMTSQSRSTTTYDIYGNVTTSAAYDFGASSPVATTTTYYGTWNGSQCVAIGSYVNDKPCNTWSTDGTNTLTNTLNSYDGKGNRLSASVWTGASSNKWVGTSATYNTNGTIQTSTPVSGLPTTYTYGACNGAFPTQSTTGSLSTYGTWNCDGGVPLNATDVNGKVTIYGYVGPPPNNTPDPFWRQSSVTDPLGNIRYTVYGQNTLESIFSFGSSVDDTITTIDGLGRKIRSQHRQGPSASNYDTVSMTYGFSGNYATSTFSIPCSQTIGGDCTSGVTTAKADPLGRMFTTTDGATTPGVVTTTYAPGGNYVDVLTTLSPNPTGENAKSAQKEFDGLGRVKSTCAILTSGGTSCGQVSSASGAAQTTFAYSTFLGGAQATATRGSQVRTKQADALGRTTYTSDPERGAVNYYYDIQAACSGSVDGHLTRTVDANGNSLCYYYDTLGRISKVAANSVTCRNFFYDNSNGLTGTKPSGVAPANSLGRMVEAVTNACNSTAIVDEWFSYDARGQMLDMWESTPHDGGGYYHTIATFAPNGSISTLSVPGLSTETYGLDGEGRPYSLQEGSTYVVHDVSYTPAGQPLVIDIGADAGDSDNYAYDSLTGRMTNWTFTVGATPKSQTGTLTWNSNGTLQKLIIGDGFNAGGAQTCTYTYDDLARLTNDDCGSLWQQTFGYDQFNNLTKSGNLTWNPGYNAANNRYTLAGTSYDNNGNLLNDSFHSYTWNEFSKMKTLTSPGSSATCGTSGTCLTYDAFGRVVEKSVGSVYTQVLYSQVGKTATMAGQTLTMAYIPTPGGSKRIANAANLVIEHKDWLGSSRLSSYPTGRTVGYDRAFAPYGEMYDNFGATDKQDFTGDTQDIVAGTFDTDNRELNPNQGRWLSPDPASSGWNLYAYGANPNSTIDPSGLQMLRIGREAGGIPFSGDSAMAFAMMDKGLGTVPADSGFVDGGRSYALYLSGGRTDNSNGFTWGSPNANALDTLGTIVSLGADTILDSVKTLGSLVNSAINSGAGCGDGTLNCFAFGGIPLGGWGSVEGVTADGAASELAGGDSYFTFGGRLSLTPAEQPSFYEGQFARPMGWSSDIGKAGLGGRTAAAPWARRGYSVYQEATDGSGYWRTSDHWGTLGTSHYDLGLTDAQMGAAGGKQVEPGFWLFDRMVTGFFRY